MTHGNKTISLLAIFNHSLPRPRPGRDTIRERGRLFRAIPGLVRDPQASSESQARSNLFFSNVSQLAETNRSFWILKPCLLEFFNFPAHHSRQRRVPTITAK